MTRRKKAIEKMQESAHQPWEIPLGGGEYGIDLEVYFGLLEREVGFSLLAYDAEEDDVVYGYEVVEMLEDEAKRGAPPRELEQDPGVTEEQLQKLKAAEEELGYRLVGYHHGSDMVMFGGELLDELSAKTETE
jgi:hypothetical protein